MTDKNCPTVNTTQQPTMADFFSFLFLGMLLGGGKSNAGFDKLGETLKRADQKKTILRILRNLQHH
jgi:hypothetical protein